MEENSILAQVWNFYTIDINSPASICIRDNYSILINLLNKKCKKLKKVKRRKLKKRKKSSLQYHFSYIFQL